MYFSAELIKQSFLRLGSTISGKTPMEKTKALFSFLAIDSIAGESKVVDLCPGSPHRNELVDAYCEMLVIWSDPKANKEAYVLDLGKIEPLSEQFLKKKFSSDFLTVPLKRGSEKKREYPSRHGELLILGEQAGGKTWGVSKHPNWANNIGAFLADRITSTPWTDLAIFVFRKSSLPGKPDLFDTLKGLIAGRFSPSVSTFWQSRIDDEKASFASQFLKGGFVWKDARTEYGFPLKDLITKPSAYGKTDAMADLFMPESEIESAIRLLIRKKNIILQGPPGVGKTFVAKRLAYLLIGAKDNDRVTLIQFHQSYSYEDFVQGFRPNKEGAFSLRNRIFYNTCEAARDNPDEKYLLVIDEINRGNLSKILGELLMLIEFDKRGEDYEVPLTYSDDDMGLFYVPENVYIIGTMNTADRSLAMVDYALRRRFSFIDLYPRFDDQRFVKFLKDRGVATDLVDKIVNRMTALNNEIESEKRNLGPGFCIGHSYFTPITDGPFDDNWYNDIVDSEIGPLIREYWFDDEEKASELIRLIKS